MSLLPQHLVSRPLLVGRGVLVRQRGAKGVGWGLVVGDVVLKCRVALLVCIEVYDCIVGDVVLRRRVALLVCIEVYDCIVGDVVVKCRVALLVVLRCMIALLAMLW
jgi:hypothetical protein